MQEVTKTILRGRRKEEDFPLGFLTALVKDEQVHFEETLARRGWERAHVRGDLDNAGIAGWTKLVDGRLVKAFSMSIGKMGQATAAIETMGFLKHTNAGIVILTGIAGSLVPDTVKIGDVVIADSVIWRTQDRISGTGQCDEYRAKKNRSHEYKADFSRNLQKFAADLHSSNASSGATFETHCGDYFTWDYVVDSERVVSKILGEYGKSLCVEMESGGFLAALDKYYELEGRAPSMGFVVKGISDNANKKVKDPALRRAACHNAGGVAVDLAEWIVSRGVITTLKANFGKLEVFA